MSTAARWFLTARPGSYAPLDVAIAAASLAATLALLHHGGVAPALPAASGLEPVGVVLAVCSAVPLLAWRRAPLLVFTVTAAAGVVMAALARPVDLMPGPTVALYLLAASRDRPSSWTGRGTTAVVGLFVAFLAATGAAHGTFPAIALLHTGLAWAAAWFAGESTRLRRQQMAELRQRAARTEQDAERERRLAVAEERGRIARDLHDSAGHAITVIAVRAGAARLRHHEDPARSLVSLQAIEELARQTADEIDQLVSGLRDPSQAGDVDPPVGLASLDTLVADHAAAGLQVTVDASGTPGRASAAADQATYRILQEALTNAARHGSGTARIELAFSETATDLTVTNPVTPTDGRSPRPSGGHGLIGMRERASLVGGSLEATRANGSFRVRAHIPYGGQRA